MVSSHPLVTACVPAFNGEEFITQTIDSVCSQTIDNIHITISVDLSDDETLKICRSRFADRGIEIIEQKQRLGFVGNIEYLLNSVKTPFAFLMPHDDLIEPTYVEVLLKLLQEHKEASVAYCDIQRFGLADTVFRQSPAKGELLYRILHYLKHIDGAVPFRGLIRMDMLNRPIQLPANSFDNYAVDTTFILQLLTYGEFVHHEACLYRKRIHSESKYHEWVLQSVAWRREAWLAHCVDCAKVALKVVRKDEDIEMMMTALCDRLLMTERDLWWPTKSVALLSQRKTTCYESSYSNVHALLRTVARK